MTELAGQFPTLNAPSVPAREPAANRAARGNRRAAEEEE